MLVLRRRTGESLMLGDDIEVEVLEISGAQVKLGIRAPKSVRLARKEIFVIGRQNLASAVPIPGKTLEHLIEKFKIPPQ